MYRTPQLCASFTLIYGDPEKKQQQQYLDALYGLTPRPMPCVYVQTSSFSRAQQNSLSVSKAQNQVGQQQNISESHCCKQQTKQQPNNSHVSSSSSSFNQTHKEKAAWVSLLTTQRPQPVYGGAFITSDQAVQNNNNNSNNMDNEKASTRASCQSANECVCQHQHSVGSSYYFTSSGSPSLAVFIPCDEHAELYNEQAIASTVSVQTRQKQELKSEYGKYTQIDSNNCKRTVKSDNSELLAKLTAVQKPWAVPCARSGHLLLSCIDHNCLVLHGGLGDAVLNDTWTFDCVTRRWSQLKCKAVSSDAANPTAHFPQCAYGQAGGMYHRSNHTHLLVVGGITTEVRNGSMEDTCVKHAYSLDLHSHLWERLQLTVTLPALWGATGQTLCAPRLTQSSPKCKQNQYLLCQALQKQKQQSSQQQQQVFVMFGGVTRFDKSLNDVYLFHLDHVLTHDEVYQNTDLYLHSVQYDTQVSRRIRTVMKREWLSKVNDTSKNNAKGNDSLNLDEVQSTEFQSQSQNQQTDTQSEQQQQQSEEQQFQHSLWSQSSNNDDEEESEGQASLIRKWPYKRSNQKVMQWSQAHASTLQHWRTKRIESFVGKYWVEKIPLPDGLRGRRRASSAAFNKHFMFIFGGRMAFDFFNDLWVFNLCTRTWVELNVRTPLVWLRRFYSEPHNAIPGQMLTAFRLQNEKKQIKSQVLPK